MGTGLDKAVADRRAHGWAATELGSIMENMFSNFVKNSAILAKLSNRRLPNCFKTSDQGANRDLDLRPGESIESHSSDIRPC